ncbi:MAG: hypothetical protein Q8L68_01700 [Methylococcales bacterium]|nr:hypothetical protein [Methylococcales bacterium]
MKKTKGKITQKLLTEMIEARKNGATYVDIEARFNVSRWTTIHYLKGIDVEKGVAEPLWKEAEEKAKNVLAERGFVDIVDLNAICPTGFFDILATKNKEKWLIDVTINEEKDLATKSIRVLPEYRCAILYMTHDLKNYRLVELKEITI